MGGLNLFDISEQSSCKILQVNALNAEFCSISHSMLERSYSNRVPSKKRGEEICLQTVTTGVSVHGCYCFCTCDNTSQKECWHSTSDSEEASRMEVTLDLSVQSVTSVT